MFWTADNWAESRISFSKRGGQYARIGMAEKQITCRTADKMDTTSPRFGVRNQTCNVSTPVIGEPFGGPVAMCASSAEKPLAKLDTPAIKGAYMEVFCFEGTLFVGFKGKPKGQQRLEVPQKATHPHLGLPSWLVFDRIARKERPRNTRLSIPTGWTLCREEQRPLLKAWCLPSPIESQCCGVGFSTGYVWASWDFGPPPKKKGSHFPV